MVSAPTFLGTVQDVQGATISIALDELTVSGLAFIDGQGYRIGQIGSFVRVSIGLVDLFGIVSHVGAGAVPEALAEVEPYGYRWLRVQLVGEGRRAGAFRRGISQYPTIGDEAHVVGEDDLRRIYGTLESAHYVRVGSLASSESIPALVDVDKLVARHSAVVGATGAGKSTTVAGIVASLSDSANYASARVLIVDIHGEYQAALRDRADVFRVNADEARGEKSLYIPYWALSFDELLRVTPFNQVGDAERAALAEKIKELKIASLKKTPRDGVTPETVTVDTPVPFSVHRLWYELFRYVCSTHTAQRPNQSPDTEAIERDAQNGLVLGEIMEVRPPKYRPITAGGHDRVYLSDSPLNLRRQIIATESALRDSRYDFLFRPGPWCPHPAFGDLDAQPQEDLPALLKDWIGGDKPVSILDLSGVPVTILNDLIGVVLRLLFDALSWARYLLEGGRVRPLLLVLEEAHAYLHPGSNGLAAEAARRIVKEGRKYGIGAMIVSQRPSEIDTTVLSQCGTVFVMRLSNATDRSHVTGAVTENLQGMFDMLPALRTGEAIVMGEAVQLPLRAVIDVPGPNRRPDSHDPVVYDSDAKRGWNRPRQAENYDRVLKNWRGENARLGGEDL